MAAAAEAPRETAVAEAPRETTPREAATASAADMAAAASVTYEALAAAFAAPATDEVVSDLQAVLEALGVGFDKQRLGQLRDPQRYYDRFVVPSSLLFVPLSEGHVRNAYVTDESISFQARYSPAADHVRACYEELGFDWRALGPRSSHVAPHAADFLGTELAFMAFLHHAGLSDQAREFRRTHLLRWVDKASDLMHRADDDAYAWLTDVTLAWVHLDETL